MEAFLEVVEVSAVAVLRVAGEARAFSSRESDEKINFLYDYDTMYCKTFEFLHKYHLETLKCFCSTG